MSLLQLDMESLYLHGNTTVSVLLPDCPRDADAEKFYKSGKKYKVLWLLHGTYGDHTDWVRRSMLEVYARERQLICVMPSGLNADYTNWPNFADGYDMWNFLLKELMPMIQNWFPASDSKEDNYIAGLSMGGMGALKYLLNNPDRFAAGCIMSWAPLNLDAMQSPDDYPFGADNSRFRNQIDNQGGFENLKNSGENSWRQIIQMHENGTLPRMYFTIGTEDFLSRYFENFHDMCQKNQIKIQFEVVPGFGHEWRFWDQALEKAMDFFGIPKDSNANAWRGLKTEKNFFVKEISDTVSQTEKTELL